MQHNPRDADMVTYWTIETLSIVDGVNTINVCYLKGTFNEALKEARLQEPKNLKQVERVTVRRHDSETTALAHHFNLSQAYLES